MALITVTDDIIVNDTPLVLAAGDDLLITEDGGRTNVNSEVVRATESGQSVTVAGKIKSFSPSDPALVLGDSGTDTGLSLTVRKGGQIGGASSDGVVAQGARYRDPECGNDHGGEWQRDRDVRSRGRNPAGDEQRADPGVRG
jgi:hypothetical protein